MAGMFYSLKETAEQLGVTEDDVKKLAQEGKLREFRDGSNLLFKIEEVQALQAGGLDMDLDLGELELEETPAEEQPADVLEEESVPALDEAMDSALDTGTLDEDMFKLDEAETPAEEAEASSELNLAPEEVPEGTSMSEDDLFLLEETGEQSAAGGEGTSEEISLAQESGLLASESDITDMDTAITGEGVNVLGESDSGYDVTDDSMAETAGPAGTDAEASLEEIEDDVNLDSFGSGSGLLDLSLQADDTSLGGILDEIYTAEGGEEEPAGLGSDATPASFEDITAEAETQVTEEETVMPEPVAVMAAAIAPVYAEAAPDTQSNILGMLLFLPLLALLYTTIVAVAAMRNVTPSILAPVQGMIWYIMGGAIVVALIVAGASFVAGGEKAPRAAKTRKEKKVRVEKTRKEKAPKAEKPAKGKKSFFGKKK